MYDVELDDLIKTESLMKSMEEFEINNAELINTINLHNYYVDMYEILEDELLYSYLGNRIYTENEQSFLLGQIIQLKSYILHSKNNMDGLFDTFNSSYLKVCSELSRNTIKNKEIQKELTDLGKYLGTSDSGKEIFDFIRSRI